MKTLIKKGKRRGFTLIELIVVIAILGILMTIAIPKFSGFKEKAILKADQVTATTIGRAIELYLIDGDGLEELKESSSSQTENILNKLVEADLIDRENCKPQYNKDKNDFEIIYYENKIEISYSKDFTIGKKTYKKLYPKLE